MRKVHVVIHGSFPLIINRFHEDAQAEATSGVHVKQEYPSPEDDAKQRLYLDAEGAPYLPAENLRQSIIQAAGRTKLGRRSATSDVAAALYVTPERLPLRGDWHVDSRAVVIQRGPRIVRHRPMFDEWEVECILEIDEALLDEKVVHKIVEDSGSYVGMGDFRPARKGPYGRFHIMSWEPVKNNESIALDGHKAVVAR